MATPIENNTEGLREILQIANNLPGAQKYGKVVVFGDSLGEGANNDMYSFVDILSESGMFSSVVKACVSSASIGPYQLDSNARGYDLNSQIERYASDIRDADIIICEYCGNDIAALLNGNIEMGTASDSATTTTICGYTKRAISRIYELNPDVTIQWVHFGETDYDVMKMGGFFFNAIDNFSDGYLLFAAEALKVIKSLGCRLMKIDFWSHEGYLSDDEVHPNMAGHAYIASTIANNLPCDEDIGHLTRPLTLTGDLVGNKNLAFDGEFGLIHKLISGGVDVPVRSGLGSITIFFHVIAIEDQWVSFLSQSNDGALISVGWNSDGSIQAAYVPAGATSAPTTGSGTIDGTYAETNNNNLCTYVKSGNVVSVQLQVEVKSNVTQTWQELKVASGLPKAVANTAGMAFYQGYSEFLQIIATTSGEIKLLPMTSPSSKTVRGQLVYIATE